MFVQVLYLLLWKHCIQTFFFVAVGREKGREEAAHSFASGDMVRVAEGELINLKGKVLSIDGNTILILPKHEDLKVSQMKYALLLKTYLLLDWNAMFICFM